MIYATWTVHFPEGSTPELVIRSRGGQASGGLMLDAFTVLGYVWGVASLTDLDEWNFTQKTSAEALALAQAVNPDCYLADDGTITSPVEELE
jgi:hypothetical protein